MIDNIKELITDYLSNNYGSPSVKVDIKYNKEFKQQNVIVTIEYKDCTFINIKKPVTVYCGFYDVDLYDIRFVCDRIMICYYQSILYAVMRGRKI